MLALVLLASFFVLSHMRVYRPVIATSFAPVDSGGNSLPFRGTTLAPVRWDGAFIFDVKKDSRSGGRLPTEGTPAVWNPGSAVQPSATDSPNAGPRNDKAINAGGLAKTDAPQYSVSAATGPPSSLL
jgi:hypothetical protein